MSDKKQPEKKGEKQEQGEKEVELHELVKKVSETNKRIDEEYDKKLKDIEKKKKLATQGEEVEEEFKTKISKLNEKLRALEEKISLARKKGKDPFIASLMLKNVKAKIKLAENTQQEKDLETVENILNNARLELVEAQKEEEVDVKKDIEEKLRQEIRQSTGKVAEEETEA